MADTKDDLEPTDFSDLNDPPGELDVLPVKPGSTTAAPVSDPPPLPTATHPASLVQAARDIGIRDNVIKALSTDDLIAHTLDLQRKLSSLDTIDARRRTEPAPVAPAPEADDPEDGVLDYLENEVGVDKKMMGLLRSRFKKQDDLEKRLKDRDEVESTRRQHSGEEAIDAAFERLGPKFEKLFGSGGLRSLESAAHKAKRLAVFRNANVDFQNDSERTIERKITKAAMEVYGGLLPADEPANAYEEPKKPNGKYTADDFARGGLAKPTATKPVKSRGQKAAAEAIRDQMQEWGIHSGSDADDFDGIPN